jgi:predicted PurR-regulated permease PerM
MTQASVRRTVMAVVALTLVVVLGFFVARIPRTVSVFLIAAFIAFGAAPLVRQLERRMPRALAIGIVYLVLLGALVVIALVVVPITYSQVAALLAHAPDYISALQSIDAHVEGMVHRTLGDRLQLPTFSQMQTQIATRVDESLSLAFASIEAIVLGTFNALVVGLAALVLSVFFVARGPAFGKSLLEFVPPRRRPKVAALFEEITQIFGHFVAGQTLLCTIVGVAVWLALAPAHFTFALLVAVLCALGYAVPFIGMLVAQLVAAMLALPQGATMVVYVTIAIFIIARVADNLLVPKIMADSVGVSPIVVMFAVFAGGELFGIPGLLLGIPAAALIKVLFKYFVKPYIVRAQLADERVRKDVQVDVEVQVVDSSRRRSTIP